MVQMTARNVSKITERPLHSRKVAQIGRLMAGDHVAVRERGAGCTIAGRANTGD